MRKILKFLDEMAGGAVADELEGALDEAVQSVRSHDKKAALTVKIELEPDRATKRHRYRLRP